MYYKRKDIVDDCNTTKLLLLHFQNIHNTPYIVYLIKL